MEEQVEGPKQKQKERLAFIDFRAYFLGEIRRSDISERFGLRTAAATRDLALYKELASENISVDPRTKSYVASRRFTPLFDHPIERVLSALSQGYGEGIGGQSAPLIPCEIPRSLNRPRAAALAPITQAINRKMLARVVYHSFSSGRTEREIAPFALVNNGLRWHVRAFDRRRERFLDFVPTRIESSELIEGSTPRDSEGPLNDIQWSRIVELELVPHPSKEDRDVIAMDYGMDQQSPLLKVQVRAALAGYFLRQWSVDCSANHEMEGAEVRLWLRNPLALYGVESAALAPGYGPVA